MKYVGKVTVMVLSNLLIFIDIFTQVH